jgi:Fungal Zn(2)-Cys(6) binuclear cluster domain
VSIHDQIMASRIARACEQCRKSKRRCKPPYPCVNCLSAGVACEVREKARYVSDSPRFSFRANIDKDYRPHRRRNQSHWSASTASQARATSPQKPLTPPSTGVSSIPDVSTDSGDRAQLRNTPNTPGLVKADTFELVRGVIAEYAFSNYGDYSRK